MAGIADREYHKAAPVPVTGRPSIYECRHPAVELGAFLDEHLPAIRDASVLDAGCGPGSYVAATAERAAQLTALDIAVGRLDRVDPGAALRVGGDVQTLPFRDDSFDVVMAMHMLYHVPDIPQAAREFRRVIRPGGLLYAFTNGERAQWELGALMKRNGCDPSAGGDFDALRFSNENGAELLRSGFDDVTLIEFTDTELLVADPEQIVDEIERNRYLYEPGLRAGVEWPAFIQAVRRDAAGIVAREGVFRMSENHGLFTCR